jgi:hypothetical protein
VYPGLWTSVASGYEGDLEGLTALSLPSDEKDRLEKEHRKMWKEALAISLNPRTPEEQVLSTRLPQLYSTSRFQFL